MVIAASALIIKNKKILLTKRSEYTSAFPNCWTCPGGRADGNETPEETVTREVKEEIGVEFTPTKLFAKGKWKDRNLFRYLGDWNGEVKVQENEVSEWNWFSYDETIKLKLALIIKKL